MSISFEKAMGIHTQALGLREKRGDILASNLANADTPNYKARDLEFSSVLKQALPSHLPLERTHALHLDARGLLLGGEVLYRQPYQASLDGNTVEAHVEQAKYAENAVQYQASLRFVNGKLSGLMSAIKGE